MTASKSFIPRCLLFPFAEGWKLESNETLQTFPTLEEAAAALPSKIALTVVLRPSRVLIERFTLPTSDREEVRSMAELQLEKMLPYPTEEIAFETHFIETGETGSVVAAAVVRISAVEEEFEPLIRRGILPNFLVLMPFEVAAVAGEARTISLFSEGAHLAFVVSEGGRLLFAQSLSSGSATDWTSELSQWMLAAEIAGVSLDGALPRLEEGLDYLEEGVRKTFGLAPERFVISPPFQTKSSNLIPPSWDNARQSLGRKARMQKNLMLAGYVYAGLVVAVIVFLVVLRLRVDSVERQLRASKPETDRIRAAETRWTALAPAVDLDRNPLETLLKIYETRPSQEVLITNFSETPSDLAVSGEAPTLEQAFQFLDALKASKELPFRLEYNPPAPTGEKVQFQIAGEVQL